VADVRRNTCTADFSISNKKRQSHVFNRYWYSTRIIGWRYESAIHVLASQYKAKLLRLAKTSGCKHSRWQTASHFRNKLQDNTVAKQVQFTLTEMLSVIAWNFCWAVVR
jgi:hypothetical protein